MGPISVRGKAKVLTSIQKTLPRSGTHDIPTLFIPHSPPHPHSLGHGGFLAFPRKFSHVWTFALAVPTAWNTSLGPIFTLLISLLPWISAQMSHWWRGLLWWPYLSHAQPRHSLSSTPAFTLSTWYVIFTDILCMFQTDVNDCLSTLHTVISTKTRVCVFWLLLKSPVSRRGQLSSEWISFGTCMKDLPLFISNKKTPSNMTSL